MPAPNIRNMIDRLPPGVRTLLRTLEERSPSTAAHGRRVAEASAHLAAFSGRFRPVEVEHAFLVGLLHDIGKLVVPLAVLDKQGALTADEWEEVRLAAPCGHALIRPFFPPGHPVVDAVRAEHERWDGGGYPDGLEGASIPEYARIALIADTLDALRSHQAYRRATGLQDALMVVHGESGRQFDPDWVDRALRLWQVGPRQLRVPPTPAPDLHRACELSFREAA